MKNHRLNPELFQAAWDGVLKYLVEYSISVTENEPILLVEFDFDKHVATGREIEVRVRYISPESERLRSTQSDAVVSIFGFQTLNRKDRSLSPA